jgi:hypothetical protein
MLPKNATGLQANDMPLRTAALIAEWLGYGYVGHTVGSAKPPAGVIPAPGTVIYGAQLIVVIGTIVVLLLATSSE